MSGNRLWWGDADAKRVLQGWHASLDGDKAARATLRRVQDVEEARTVPAYARLVRELRQAGYEISPWRTRTMAAEAVAVVAVKRDDRNAEPGDWRPDHVADCFVKAWVETKISGQRLRILLGTEAPDLFSMLLRGALGMMGNKEVGVPVVAVAEIARLHHWPDRRTKMRRAILFAAALKGLFDEDPRHDAAITD